MSRELVEGRVKFEHGMLLATILLMGIGLVMVYSATAYLMVTPEMLKKTGGNSMYYLERQFMFVALGLLTLAAATFMPFRWIEKLAWPALFGSFGAMILVLIFGKEHLGAVRWFQFGSIWVQPGELVKLAFVVWVSHSLAFKEYRILEFRLGVLPHLLVAMMLVGLYLAQPDLGSCIILLAVLMALLFIAGVPWKHIGVLGLAGGLMAATVLALDPEKLGRVWAWLDPEQFADGDGYQLVNSKISIASGGMFGSGLGGGQQNIAGYVPEAETDFIFSVIGEELGMIGCLVVLALFGYVLWRGLKLAGELKNRFARHMVFGATLLVVLQAAINIGVATGTLPTKGLTLPFVSLGGSSMVVMAACVGVLLNASRTFPRMEPAGKAHAVEAGSVQVFVKESA
ncbi:MAG: cell division protein FtsW [Deltaproteobacteria bacterium]|nr:cell division protein FtsW [Deltaproteobacteria bacterium]